jgi:hypothetical protein
MCGRVAVREQHRLGRCEKKCSTSCGQRWQKRMLPLHCRIRTESCVGGVGASERLSRNAKNTHDTKTNDWQAGTRWWWWGGQASVRSATKWVLLLRGQPAAHTDDIAGMCLLHERIVVLLLCPAQQTKCESARVGRRWHGEFLKAL